MHGASYTFDAAAAASSKTTLLDPPEYGFMLITAIRSWIFDLGVCARNTDWSTGHWSDLYNRRCIPRKNAQNKGDVRSIPTDRLDRAVTPNFRSGPHERGR